MKKTPWTTKEREILRKYYHTIPKEQLLEMLPGRTLNSCTKQVYYLRKRGWTFEKNLLTRKNGAL